MCVFVRVESMCVLVTCSAAQWLNKAQRGVETNWDGLCGYIPRLLYTIYTIYTI